MHLWLNLGLGFWRGERGLGFHFSFFSLEKRRGKNRYNSPKLGSELFGARGFWTVEGPAAARGLRREMGELFGPKKYGPWFVNELFSGADYSGEIRNAHHPLSEHHFPIWCSSLQYGMWCALRGKRCGLEFPIIQWGCCTCGARVYEVPVDKLVFRGIYI